MRPDSFEKERKHLANLTDEELHARFWQLAGEVTAPLLELARTHTSPSIERSVLLRMGFNSLEAKGIVEKCMANCLLGRGAGHVVLKWAGVQGIGIREAGIQLIEMTDWRPVVEMFAREGSA